MKTKSQVPVHTPLPEDPNNIFRNPMADGAPGMPPTEDYPGPSGEKGKRGTAAPPARDSNPAETPHEDSHEEPERRDGGNWEHAADAPSGLMGSVPGADTK